MKICLGIVLLSIFAYNCAHSALYTLDLNLKSASVSTESHHLDEVQWSNVDHIVDNDYGTYAETNGYLTENNSSQKLILTNWQANYQLLESCSSLSPSPCRIDRITSTLHVGVGGSGDTYQSATINLRTQNGESNPITEVYTSSNATILSTHQYFVQPSEVAGMSLVWYQSAVNGTEESALAYAAELNLDVIFRSDVVGVTPSEVYNTTSGFFSVYGGLFVQLPNFTPRCRIGSSITEATIVDSTSIRCPIMPQETYGTKLVEIDLGGDNWAGGIRGAEYLCDSYSTCSGAGSCLNDGTCACFGPRSGPGCSLSCTLLGCDATPTFNRTYGTYFSRTTLRDLAITVSDDNSNYCIIGSSSEANATSTYWGINQTGRQKTGPSMDTFFTCFNEQNQVIISSWLNGGMESTTFLDAVHVDTHTIVISGISFTTNFSNPCTTYGNVLQMKPNAFIAIVDISTGNYRCSIFGGAENNGRAFLASDGSKIFVGGQTRSVDFPVTANITATPTTPGKLSGFLAIFNLDGIMEFSSYISGTTDQDTVAGLEVNSDSLILFGRACSNDFPTTKEPCSPLQTSCPYFIMKVSHDGELQMSRYFGGRYTPIQIQDIAVDNVGNYYVLGAPQLPGFPTTPGVYQQQWFASTDSLIAKYDSNDDLVFATYYGGRGRDSPSKIHVDESQEVYIIGLTDNNDGLPSFRGSFTHTSKSAIFISTFTSTGSDVKFATLYAPQSNFMKLFDSTLRHGNFWVVGGNHGTPFADITPGAYQATPSNNFIQKYRLGMLPPVSPGRNVCPPNQPILCPNKVNCVSNAFSCPVISCQTPLFKCFDGSCVQAPRLCNQTIYPGTTTTGSSSTTGGSGSDCPPGQSLCWNTKKCANRCDPVPSCPILFRRCADGSCIPGNGTCEDYSCPLGEVPCADGSCASSLSECPAYDGCSGNTPILCANGRCVSNVASCVCPQGLLCSDGTCSSNCEEDVRIRGRPLTINVVIEDAIINRIRLVSRDLTSYVGEISIPPATIRSRTIIISHVPDSILGSTTIPDVVLGRDIRDFIVSPVIDVSVDEEGSTNLNNDATVILPVIPRSRGERICLARLNEATNQWVCESEAQVSDNSDVPGGVVASGTTRRVSKFAMLLRQREEDDERKPNGGNAGVIASVVVVVVFVFVAIIAGSLYIKKRKRSSRRLLEST